MTINEKRQNNYCNNKNDLKHESINFTVKINDMLQPTTIEPKSLSKQ